MHTPHLYFVMFYTAVLTPVVKWVSAFQEEDDSVLREPVYSGSRKNLPIFGPQGNMPFQQGHPEAVDDEPDQQAPCVHIQACPRHAQEGQQR